MNQYPCTYHPDELSVIFYLDFFFLRNRTRTLEVPFVLSHLQKFQNSKSTRS